MNVTLTISGDLKDVLEELESVSSVLKPKTLSEKFAEKNDAPVTGNTSGTQCTAVNTLKQDGTLPGAGIPAGIPAGTISGSTTYTPITLVNNQEVADPRKEIKRQLEKLGIEYNHKCATPTLAKLLKTSEEKLKPMENNELKDGRISAARNSLLTYIDTYGADKAEELLGKFGAKKLSDLNELDLESFITASAIQVQSPLSSLAQ